MPPQLQPSTAEAASPPLPRRSTFTSIMPTTQQGKEWASAVADSPIRHAILNRPFTLLRMRTESLLDTITGGTLPSAVHEAERRQKDADRQLKCRGCKVIFGDERGLIRHHDLFPAHVNPPEYKRKPKRRSSRRSQSTSNVLTSPPTLKAATTRHMRAATMANPETVADGEADAPHPIEAMPVFKEVQSPRRSRPRPLASTPSQRQLDDAEQEQGSLSAFTRTPQASDAMPGSSLAQAPPLLPALDYDFDSFKLISQETGKSPVHARPVTKSTGTDALEEKNRAAGAASALNMATRQEEKRKLTRGASESALDTLTIPTTIQDAARAIIATGKAGRSEPAVVGGSMTPKAQAMYAALAGEEDVNAAATPSSSKSSPTINWSLLKGPLVDAPEKKFYAVATGPTTFSRYQDGLPSSRQNLPTTTSTFPRILTRKSTNPFLNDAFMTTMSTSKTPPLSPSSAAFSRTPPALNPFARLPDEPFNFDTADDQEHNFFLDAPSTPLDLDPTSIATTTTTTTSNKSRRNPFIKRDSDDDHDIVSYLPRSESAPILSTLPATKIRGVHFDAETALKASDSPRCPSCRRAFVDLQSVLSHVDGSDCNPFHLSEGQAILAS